MQDKEKSNGLLNTLKENFPEESVKDLRSLIEQEFKSKQQPAESSAPSEAPADPLRPKNRWSSKEQDPNGQPELEESQPQPQYQLEEPQQEVEESQQEFQQDQQKCEGSEPKPQQELEKPQQKHWACGTS